MANGATPGVQRSRNGSRFALTICSAVLITTTVWYALLGLYVCSRCKTLSQSKLLLTCLQPCIPYHGRTVLCSQLVSTDANFQAIYDAVMVQVILFMVYVVIRDSYKAGR